MACALMIDAIKLIADVRLADRWRMCVMPAGNLPRRQPLCRSSFSQYNSHSCDFSWNNFLIFMLL